MINGNEKSRLKSRLLVLTWCPGEDSNLHALASART
jgi:hypothetical protein